MSAIRRSPRPQRFDILDQRVVRDRRLSYRARGILARLLSNEDGFSMTAADLARDGLEGRGSILTALKELRTLGYVVTHRRQDERGRWSTESIVYDSPQTIESDTNPPKSRKRTSVPRTPVRRASESSTPTEQFEVRLKNNNSSVLGLIGCCDDAKNLISSTPAKLSHKQQRTVQSTISDLQPDLQVKLLGELIRQRAAIKNPEGWMVNMVGLALKGGFVHSTDNKQVAVASASFLPRMADIDKDKIAQGKLIWERLDSIRRNGVAIALEKHLETVQRKGLSLKQLRMHGIDHSDVSRDLFMFLAEAQNPPDRPEQPFTNGSFSEGNFAT